MAALTESLLRAGGFKTGLFTSPHLVDVRERVRINGRVLDKDTFAGYFWKVHDAVSSAVAEYSVHLHYFHFLTVLGFYIFQEEQVDVAIMEVGLGGRLDSTNVLPRPVVCGITLLDYDHVAILGKCIFFLGCLAY
jgi:folylpolyglutamate synthase